MADTIKYENVKVTLGVGIERDFDFEIVEHEASVQFAMITTNNYQLVVDEDLAYLKGDMPPEWRQPVLAKLRALLEAKEFPEGP
jgi:hypothetical protein